MSVASREAISAAEMELEEYFDEAACIQAAQSGDTDAIGSLYAHHRDAVLGHLSKKTRDAHLAEDLTQETFIKMVRFIDKFEDTGKGIRPWLNRVADNTFINRYRKDQKAPQVDSLDMDYDNTHAEPTAREAGPEEIVGHKLELENVLDAIKRSDINPGILAVWGLVTLEDYSNKEIQSMLDLANGTVHSRLNRGRKGIKKLAESSLIDAPTDATFGLSA